MKKKLLTLSAAVLATVALSSCGPKVNDDVEAIETTKINVWATAAEQAVVEEVIKNWNIDKTFKPKISDEVREKRIKGWNKAVKYAYGWAKED